ncbi:MAG: hypothetical protein AAFU73_14470 [Planctomycetota bacterium]
MSEPYEPGRAHIDECDRIVTTIVRRSVWFAGLSFAAVSAPWILGVHALDRIDDGRQVSPLLVASALGSALVGFVLCTIGLTLVAKRRLVWWSLAPALIAFSGLGVLLAG